MLDDLFAGDDERAAAAAQRVTAADLPGLLAALGGADPEARWWAVGALAHLPGPEATTALMGVAADADPEARWWAVGALAHLPGPEATTALMGVAADADPHVRALETVFKEAG